MSTSKNHVSFAPHGLSLLMMHEKPSYFSKPEHCQKYVNPWPIHPFGLDVPRSSFTINTCIDFVGAHATDMTVEAFLVQIREHAGYADGTRITKLRVINVHDPRLERNQHYVFFEFWVDDYKVIVSGETNDYSGAGNSARCDLENVFAVLSNVYELPIERVTLNRPLTIQALYAEQIFQEA